MLERATGCLENGGRRLLRLTPKSSQTRRSLHSAFWCHGAGDIDLPSWWISLLQQPPPEKVTKTQSIADTARRCLSTGLLEGGFLDFLYPAKTLSLIHTLAIRDARQLSHRSPRLASQPASRSYSSDAVKPRVAISSDYDHAMGLISQIQQRSVSPISGNVVNAPISSQGIAELRTLRTLRKKYNIMRTRYNKRFGDTPPPEDMTEALFMLTRIKKFESRLNERLSKRFHDMFADIPLQRRRETHYMGAVAAAMYAEDHEGVVQLYAEAQTLGLCRDVLMQRLLWYAVTQRKCQFGAEVWETWMQSCAAHTMRCKRSPQEIFVSLDQMPLHSLVKRARAIGRDVLNLLQDIESEVGSGVRDFAVQLLLHGLRGRGKGVTARNTLATFAVLGQLTEHTPESYSLGIEQLLSVETIATDNAAIRLYEDMLKLPNLIPPEPLFDGVIARLAAIHDDGHLRRVLEDYRKRHKVLSARACILAMGEMSYQGDADAFHNLFEEYQASYGNPTTSMVYQQLLHVHARRMEIREVVEIFQTLETRYDFRPTIDCWNVVLAAFARLSDPEGALKWYSQMIEAGMKPDSHTYSTLATMYAPGGDIDSIVNLIDECDSRGLKISTSMYDSLVLATLGIDDFEAAERIVSDALKMDLVGSRTHMWNYLLNAVALQRDLDKLQYLFQCMQEADIPADEVTYGALMQGLCVHGMAESAWLILSHIMPRKQLRPTAFHYAIIFGGFLNSGKYSKVVECYRKMLSNGIKSSFSTQTLLLKAVANLDTESTSKQPHESNQAEAILATLLENMDVKDMAPNFPQKGIGSQALDEAYISNYFEYLIYLSAEKGRDDKVADLFSQYLQTAQRLRPNSQVTLPLKMITALMVSCRRLEQHDEVERMWYLAVEKAQGIARRSGASLSEPGWVLPARRFILTIPLVHYMHSLLDCNRIDDIDPVLVDLTTAGYGVASSVWNTYVQSLVLGSRPRKALQVAERELMRGWRGWKNNRNMTNVSPSPNPATVTSTTTTPTTTPEQIEAPTTPPRNAPTPAERNLIERGKATPFVFSEQKPRYLKSVQTIQFPTYKTMVMLARAYLDIKEEYRRNFASDIRRRLKIKGMANPMLKLLRREAPRALRAVETMPMQDNELQSQWLRGERIGRDRAQD